MKAALIGVRGNVGSRILSELAEGHAPWVFWFVRRG
jgi:hypothetical protein